MAQANVYITCDTCKKEFRHTKICVNRTAAESYEEWAKANITMCPTCYKAACRKAEEQKQRKALTANIMKRAWAIAREGAEKFGGKASEYFAESLRMAWKEIKAVTDTPLTGSEKQIAWASRIRKSAWAMLLAGMKSKHVPEAVECANKKTSASWWIDNEERFTSPRGVGQAIRK